MFYSIIKIMHRIRRRRTLGLLTMLAVLMTSVVGNALTFFFFEGPVQPDLTIVRRELSRLVTALSDAQHVQRSALPAELRGYLDAIRALDADLVSASTEHAQAWQRLLGQCGRMPDRGDRDSAA